MMGPFDLGCQSGFGPVQKLLNRITADTDVDDTIRGFRLEAISG